MSDHQAILFCADIHGNIEQYKKITSFAIENNIRNIILGGDLLPKDGGRWNPANKIRTPSAQVKFIKKHFIPWVLSLSKRKIKIYFIFGNDDFRVNESLVKSIGSQIYYLANGTPIKISQKVSIIGYPYVSLTPFLNKDWEKWDTSNYIANKIFTKRGFKLQSSTRHIPVDYDLPQMKSDTIQKDLEVLAQLSLTKKTIFLFHDAPYNTFLDMTTIHNPFTTNKNRHVGSQAILGFIKKHQPFLTLHGHIHHTFEVSKHFRQTIGKTIALTCGNLPEDKHPAVIVFDIQNPSKARRIILK